MASFALNKVYRFAFGRFVNRETSSKEWTEKERKYFDNYDPIYEYIPKVDRHGRVTGNLEKVKKRVPLCLSPHDQKVLKRARKWAHRLDTGHSLCGIKFGWSAIIGLLPFLGDGADVLLGLCMIWMVMDRVDGGIPMAERSRMMLNVGIDGFIGLTPFLGDFADALFKANSMNCKLLEQGLMKRHGHWIEHPELMVGPSVVAKRQNTGRIIDEQPTTGTNMEFPVHDEKRERSPPPRYETNLAKRTDGANAEPTRPAPAKLAQLRNTSEAWISKMRGRQDELDLEKGQAAPTRPPRPEV